MGDCQKLKKVSLGVGEYKVTRFPRGLKELCGFKIARSIVNTQTTIIVNMDRTSLEQSFEDCNISTYIKFVTS